MVVELNINSEYIIQSIKESKVHKYETEEERVKMYKQN